MTKVFQTVVDKGKGNCMQATVASLFNKELSEVPNFIEFGEGWWSEKVKFFKKQGYSIDCFYRTDWTVKFYTDALKHDGGVNGLFYAVVPSQTFKEVTHAVIVDSDLKVVHDPNPNQKCLMLKPKDIEYVLVVKEGWHVDYDKKEFVIDKV